MTKRTKAILALGGVFLVGALCGALALGAFVRGEVRSAQRLRDRGGFHEYFVDRLELTVAQRDSLQEELDWFYEQFAGLRIAAAGEYHELIDSLDKRLVVHLSPEQVRRLRDAEGRLRENMPRPEAIPGAGAASAARVTPAEEPRPPHRPRDTAATRSSRLPITSARTPPATPDARDTAARIDTTRIATDADPGPELDRFGASLKSRLKLDDEQLIRVTSIVGATRRAIRRDVREMRGFPKLQLEIARQHLRTMDRDILSVLDETQRALYAPVGEEIARRVALQLAKGAVKRSMREKKSKGPGAPARTRPGLE